jgi:hypothetical protein
VIAEKRSFGPFFIYNPALQTIKAIFAAQARIVWFTTARINLFPGLFRNQKDNSKMEHKAKVIFVD